MTELTFLRDLAIVMAVSAATTILFHMLHQPVVLGYIVAGRDYRPSHSSFLVCDGSS
jgi:Kef-type K+ transport system membrane component KefB